MAEGGTMLFSVTTVDENSNSKFEALYFAYSKYLFSIGINILRNEEHAADALQQCYIKIFEHIDKIGEINSTKTKSFVSIIMRNESINLLRKIKTSFHVTEPLDDALYIIIDETANTEEILLRSELQDEMKSYLGKLNKEESNLLMLKYVHEYRSEDIADILGVSQEVVRQRLSRVRRKLAAMIMKEKEEA